MLSCERGLRSIDCLYWFIGRPLKDIDAKDAMDPAKERKGSPLCVPLRNPQRPLRLILLLEFKVLALVMALAALA